MNKVWFALMVTLGLMLPATCRPATATGTWSTSSTNYCLRGGMKNGQPTHDGVVAVNSRRYRELAGRSFEVLSGPYAGKHVIVKDMGPRAQFDIWVASCAAARSYGRRTIEVREIPTVHP